jgi:hypothetical protein
VLVAKIDEFRRAGVEGVVGDAAVVVPVELAAEVTLEK